VLRILVLVLVTVLALGGLFVALRPDPSAEGPRERTVELAIEGDAMTPAQVTVGEGDRVNLRITADRPVELHLHGYDLEKEVEPEETAELSFEADLTGRFELEAEQTGTELGTLVVEPRRGG
jgi:FtsP/CotA-like multicopper oxidase with cupredoxin domain